MKKVITEFKVKPAKGDLGIEIEVEGSNLPTPEKFWRREADGSLRGEESAEYVFSRPRTLKEAREALDYLAQCYIDNESVIDDTVRAGVHVHVNCQDLTMVELYNFMTLFFVFENVLTKFCGEYRQGNLFCLRACDADRILHVIRAAAKDRKFRQWFHHDNNRYAAMNIKALGDYGSLEFRAMRSTSDMDIIYIWAKILYDLREKAKTYTSPYEIIAGFSQYGSREFMKQVFGSNVQYLFNEYKNTSELESDLFKGMRNAQDIAFCADWESWSRPPRIIGGLEFDPLIEGTIDEPLEDF